MFLFCRKPWFSFWFFAVCFPTFADRLLGDIVVSAVLVSFPNLISNTATLLPAFFAIITAGEKTYKLGGNIQYSSVSNNQPL
jgi:hypothetical protein